MLGRLRLRLLRVMGRLSLLLGLFRLGCRTRVVVTGLTSSTRRSASYLQPCENKRVASFEFV
jgi:hypothetical protein